MALPTVRSSNTPGRWDPFREFEDLYSQMSRWMESVVGRLEPDSGSWWPAADLAETEDAYHVEVELPGVKRDDITIDLVGSELTVNGELTESEQKGRLRQRGRRTGRFHYQVTLPHDVDAERVEATLDQGVLTVRVPKSETAKPRRIEISNK
ncbi:Hsp20/alpha crystallin family protein [Haloechinothrix sp. LS1_15]|uniref:Hsp20/alpha crystallin family protein n=1 Tax=Haloechinothrix sp. LS1_15 TaxID=2652248 RepID=UPI0029481675|nr:Hsp20/alpha crystallin family protein [Haloechinothrix sp. LS1_15]MDV6011749.1 Hsp20/alpha crystallin family protein [Haloechinothrix sp. LS1_15]